MSEKKNYIYEYYQAINNGDVIVGNYIKTLYTNIVKGLENKDFHYSGKNALLAINYIEKFCRHHEGEKAQTPVKLELWQKAMISVMFGILDGKGARQFREVVVVIGRKNGKTLLAAAIASYMIFMDGEYGARVYFSAPKLEQANLCYDAFYQMIKQEPALDTLCKKRRTDIYIEQNNSTAKPLAFSAKKSDGLNVSLGVCDEVASWEGEGGLKFYEVLKSSMGARKQPMLLSITTAGYVNDSTYDELFKRCTRVLKGDSSEKRLLPFLYVIDDVSKWNSIDELQKANPNLGVSVTVDYLLEEMAVAEGSLSKRSEFITKYANIKQNSSQAWLDSNTINKAYSGKHLAFQGFTNNYCVVGVDLSRTTDLTACVCVVEKDGILNIFCQFFMPKEKLEEATAKDGIPYSIYVQRGFLTLSGDNFVDYHDCYNWISNLVNEYKLYPLKVGYDRYSAQYLIQDLESSGYQTDDVFQGFNLSPVIKEFEGLMKDGKVNIGDNDLLKIHLYESALKVEEETEKCRLIKLNNKSHIDGAAALLDAMTVRQKWADEIGEQLHNR